MIKLMVPVDGSEGSSKAVQYVINSVGLYKEPVELHILNVQYPIISGNVRHFISHDELDRYYRENAEAAMKPAIDMLQKAGVAHIAHTALGDPAETVVQLAQEKGCSQIVMTPRGLGNMAGMLLGSVTSKVIHMSTIPVVLVK
ncbi:universal stress protein [Lacisediminimonas sp.]|uniref:universal stress protein n=1 Tax=Lacisediminimonas sp. TaxID=3060582 RepID=UPI0027268486|nr:universal stress protein [Lacisediminimonas sp.]MDO8298149.1 universal stress protein [Lacisediminimonas sp.]